jgi:hypothetical protein
VRAADSSEDDGIALPQVKKLTLDETVSPTAGRRFTRA